MSFYLCVDCGGSKTAVAIADNEGVIVARAHGGPSNFAYLGIANFTSAVKEAIEFALKELPGVEEQDKVTLPSPTPMFAAAWFGISGCDSPANVALLTPVLAELLSLPAPSPRLSICNDAHLLAAPLVFHPDVKYAVAAVAGTGSIVTTFRRGTGDNTGHLEELSRTGGYGWILGDEGGGFDVGREAMRRVLQEEDLATLQSNGRPDVLPNGKKTLRTRVLELFGIQSPYDLLTIVHDADPLPVSGSSSNGPLANGVSKFKLMFREKRLSSLAPTVFVSAFEDEDPTALNVLRTTSASLAGQISILLRLSDDQNANPRAAYAPDCVISFGGSLAGVERYRNFILDALSKRGHSFKYVEFINDAAATGAASLASRFK